ncbi:uncharacterized protein LOC113231942 isoform X2 [Hyposmocoma kahamanoa]|nr:uncharacterized protein LOC113231942 isoform X2 [Hyposmocoma kahamanoa]
MDSLSLEQLMIRSIEHCLVPKLSRDFEECETHGEFDIYKNRFSQHFYELIKLLDDADLKENLKGSTRIIAYLWILYVDLQTNILWTTEVITEYTNKFNASFELIYGVKLDDVLKAEQLDRQAIFDKAMEELHQKLTPENFKKYPSLIDVYNSIIQDVKDFKIQVNLVKTLPIALLLIEDFVPTNRISGLKSCASILQHVEPNVFDTGNYYEVIHGTLLKAFTERDAEVTNLVIGSLLQLLLLLPDSVKEQKTDETYALTLEQVLNESNVYRKLNLYRFTTKLIQMLRTKCAKRRRFHLAIVDGIILCCNKDIQDVLLNDVLECLKEWIKHTWCVWNLQTDYRILAEMMKLQCASKPENCRKVVKLIATLITICTEDEQLSIVKCLEQPPRQFTDRVEEV